MVWVGRTATQLRTPLQFNVGEYSRAGVCSRERPTHGGGLLTVIDAFSRRCLAIVVARRLRSDDVLHCLTDLMRRHGRPEHIRSDNGPEFVAKSVRSWLGRIGVKTLYGPQEGVAARHPAQAWT
jgi:transposase InsO family protein